MSLVHIFTLQSQLKTYLIGKYLKHWKFISITHPLLEKYIYTNSVYFIYKMCFLGVFHCFVLANVDFTC